ncbi:hypothetical protein LJC58_07650 [Lachnospiraceae bacterium OttesenSCG-928-D06]|nr:hypothetical protein [Lachnospiraceae bacterium OttesenSCG-928-D06]
MRLSRTFNKTIIPIMFLVLLMGCNNTKPTDEVSKITPTAGNSGEVEKNTDVQDYYSIIFVNTSKIKDLLWSEEFSFDIIQIEDMSKETASLEDTINTNIKEAMTSWIEGKIFNVDSVDLTITCHSSRYLSFVNSFVYESNQVDVINDYVTIDILTGQRVYLCDLVEINEEFVTYLQENPDKIKTPPQPLWQGIDLSEYSPSELLEALDKCSYTQEELIRNGYYSIEESIGSLLFRNSFFLRNGKLVITIEQGGESFITLDVEDIEDFLKVDKW